jgi:hypothetical protein
VVRNITEDIEELVLQVYNKEEAGLEDKEDGYQGPQISYNKGLELVDQLIQYEEGQEDINVDILRAVSR